MYFFGRLCWEVRESVNPAWQLFCSGLLSLCLQIVFSSWTDEHKHEVAVKSVSAHLQLRLQAFSREASTFLCKAVWCFLSHPVHAHTPRHNESLILWLISHFHNTLHWEGRGEQIYAAISLSLPSSPLSLSFFHTSHEHTTTIIMNYSWHLEGDAQQKFSVNEKKNTQPICPSAGATYESSITANCGNSFLSLSLSL